jgi:hypothetical protein
MGLRGTFNYSEKLGYEGTTFYKDDTEQDPDFQVIVLRLAVFRGGIIDYQSCARTLERLSQIERRLAALSPTGTHAA